MELDEADEMVGHFVLIHCPNALTLCFSQISQMEVEIQGIPQSLKGKFQGKSKACKADLAKLKKQAVRPTIL